MLEPFDLAHTFTALWEGGLVDNPADPGGITNYGISYVFLRDYAQKAANRDWLASIGVKPPVTAATIRALTKPQAYAIFRRAFWDVLKLDDFPRLPDAAVYDAAVNCGIAQSVKFLQSVLGVAADGIMGPVTRGQARIANALSLGKSCCAARKTFYANLVRTKPRFAQFLSGWNNRVTALEVWLDNPAHAPLTVADAGEIPSVADLADAGMLSVVELADACTFSGVAFA